MSLGKETFFFNLPIGSTSSGFSVKESILGMNYLDGLHLRKANLLFLVIKVVV
jgi:hypothetical protein